MEISSTAKMAHKDIIEYYERCRNAYKDAWDLDKNMQLNLGLWYKNTKNLAGAMENLNAEIALRSDVGSGSVVLDAGCGVGGTCIYLVNNHDCETHGISLVPQQIKNAIENAKKKDASRRTHFQVMDYCDTTYPDEYFDIVVGIESICHAESKYDFLKEAHRILKPGGRLVLAENLQAKKTLTTKEYDQLYTYGFNGCKITSLDTADQYMQNLKNLGFHKYECEDMTSCVAPSVRRIRRFYYPAWLYNQIRALTGRPFGETEKANTRMCYYLYTGLKNKLWSYGLIRAVK